MIQNIGQAKEVMRDICGRLCLDPLLCEVIETSRVKIDFLNLAPEFLMLINNTQGLSINQLAVLGDSFNKTVDGIHAAGNVLVLRIS